MKQCTTLLHGSFFISSEPYTLNVDTRITDVAAQTMKGDSFSAKLLQRMTNGDSPVMAVDQRMTKGGTPVTKLDRPLDTQDTLPEPGEAWPASRDRWRWRPPAFDGRSPDLTLRSRISNNDPRLLLRGQRISDGDGSGLNGGGSILERRRNSLEGR